MPPAAKGGGGSGAVRAGRAFVELFAQDNKLYRALDQAQARLKQFGAFSQKIGLTAGAGASVVLAPMAKTFTDAVTRGAKIDQLAKRFGITTEATSSLAYAFETAGVNLEEFEGAVDGIAGRVRSAADANEELIQGLKGLNGRNLIQDPIDKQLDRIVDAFARIKNPVDQATVAQDLFGASGLKMLEVLKRGSAALAERKARAGPGGGLVSQADATRSTQLLAAYTEAWQGVKYTLLEVGAALLPLGDGVGDASARVRQFLSGVRGWVQDNRDLIQTTAQVAAGVAAGGVALVAFGSVLKAAGIVVGAVVIPLKLVAAGVLAIGAAATAAKIALTSAFLPELLLAVGIGMALAELFGGELKQGFRAFADDAGEAWGSIVEAIKRGDIGAAAAVGISFVKLEWARMVAYLTEAWNEFKATFLDGWRDISYKIVAGWAGLFEDLGVLPEGTFDEAENIHRGEMEKNRRDREAAVAAAREELRIAKEKFDAANQAARGGGVDWVRGMAEAAMQGARAVAGARQIQNQPRPKLPTQGELFNAVKGTFALPYARMQLGYGDNAAKRQLDAAVNTAKNTAELPAIKDGVKDLAKQLTFK